MLINYYYTRNSYKFIIHIILIVHISQLIMLKVTIFPIVFFLSCCLFSSESARILVVFGQPVPSIFSLTRTLVEELVKRGHDATFISAFESKLNEKNVRDIVLTRTRENHDDYRKRVLEFSQLSQSESVNQFLLLSDRHIEQIFNNTGVQDLLKSNEKFDVVIICNYFGEGLFAFGYHFDCPVIYFSAFEPNFWVNHLAANPEPASYIPQMMSGWPINMNFWQRMQNFLLKIKNEIIYTGFHIDRHNEIVHRYFPTAPNLREIMKERIALILMNSNPTISSAKPLLPNMIEIGGFHIKEPKPLPKELQTYLDSATEGFILFSMGSNLKSTMFPPDKLEIFMKVFAKLPYPILCKFENDQIPGKPDNVRIEKWLPQNDILAHPNLILFITHGGLLSTIETVYHGVPIVGIPVFGDQTPNMIKAEQLGIGKYIEYQKISYDGLLAMIEEVLYNRTYTETVKYKSILFKDKSERPLDTAMFWIEYVIRHKYSNHLKTSGIHLKWYQLKSLDVIAFLVFVVLVALYIIQLILKKFCTMLKSNYCISQSMSNGKKAQ